MGEGQWRIQRVRMDGLPRGANSFIFMQFLVKNNCNIIRFWALAPLLEENPGSPTEGRFTRDVPQSVKFFSNFM